MPLRHLTLKDPQYVPRYNQLDPTTVGRVFNDVQRQTENFQSSRRTTYDTFDAALNETFAPLNEQERLAAGEIIDTTRSRIDEYVQRYGARGSMDFLETEARKATKGLQPMFQKSQYINMINKSLAESDADAEVKNYVASQINDIEFDDQGRPQTYRGAVSAADLEVVKNWKDPIELAKDFTANYKMNSDEEMRPGASSQLASGDMIYYRQKFSSLGYDDVEAATVAHLLSDRQVRAQLDLMGRIDLEKINKMAEEQGGKPRIEVDSDGRVTTQFDVLRQNENGRYLDSSGNVVDDREKAQVITKSRTFGSKAEWKAQQYADPYARKLNRYERSYDIITDKTGRSTGTSGRTGINSRFIDDFGLHRPSENAPGYISNAYEQTQGYAQQEEAISNQVGEYAQRLGLGTSYSDQGELRLYHQDGSTYGLDQALESGIIDQTQYINLSNKEAARQEAILNMKSIEEDLNRIQETTLNRLAENPDYAFIIDAVEFNDSGTVTFDPNKVKQLAQEGKLQTRDFSSGNYRLPLSRRQQLERELRVGEAQEITVDFQQRGIVSSAGTGGAGEVSQSTVFAVKKEDGSIEYIDPKDPIAGDFSRDLSRIRQEVVDSKLGVGFRNELIHRFDPTTGSADEEVIKQINESIENSYVIAGSAGVPLYSATTGKQIDLEYAEGERFQAQGYLFDGFEPAIGGIVERENGDPERVIIKGTYATDVISKQLGPQFQDVIRARMLRSYLPSVISDKSYTAEIIPSQLKSMGFNINQPVKLKSVPKRRNGVQVEEFELIAGDKIYYASTLDELQANLFDIEAGLIEERASNSR